MVRGPAAEHMPVLPELHSSLALPDPKNLLRPHHLLTDMSAMLKASAFIKAFHVYRAGIKEEGHIKVPASPRGVLRNSELGSLIPNSPQSVNRALHRQKFLSMRHRVCLAAPYLVHSSP